MYRVKINVGRGLNNELLMLFKCVCVCAPVYLVYVPYFVLDVCFVRVKIHRLRECGPVEMAHSKVFFFFFFFLQWSITEASNFFIFINCGV